MTAEEIFARGVAKADSRELYGILRTELKWKELSVNLSRLMALTVLKDFHVSEYLTADEQARLTAITILKSE